MSQEPVTVRKLSSYMVIDTEQAQWDFDYEHALADAGHPAAMPGFILRQMDANARVLGLTFTEHEHPRDASDEWLEAETTVPWRAVPSVDPPVSPRSPE